MNLKSIAISLFFIIYGALSWKYYVCNIKNLCPESDIQHDVEPRYPIQFYKNSDTYLLGDFDTYADSIIGMSAENKIDIVGYFTSNEVNSTSFENLGTARAHLIKDLLINRGLDSNRVQVFGSQQVVNFQDSMAVLHMTDVSASLDMNSKDVQMVSHYGITEIYFPSNSKNEIKNEALDKYLSSLVSSAKENKIRLIGHTDNVGDEETNRALSLAHAYTIRNQLIKLGMPMTNIICEGKGSSQPKVNNSNSENRALNRRLEINVQ